MISHFTKDEAVTLETRVLDIAEPFLNGKFAAAPYNALIAGYGGLEVTHAESAAFKHMEGGGAKKPLLYLSIEDGDHRIEDWRTLVDGAEKLGYRHIVTIKASIITNDQSGEIVGDANPVASGQRLRDLIRSIWNGGVAELHALKIHEAKADPGSAGSFGAGEAQKLNPVMLQCVVFSLKF